MAIVQPADNAQAMAFAECRALGHSWKHRGTFGTDDQPTDKRFSRPFGLSTGMVGYHSRCPVCRTDRVKWITRSGEVVSRYYHPDGYSQHGDDRLTARGWRSTFVATLFDELTSHVA